MELVNHELDGVHVHHLYVKPGKSKFVSYKKALAEANNKLQIEQNFDIIHFNILSESWLAILWMRKRFSMPFLLTEHWTGYNPERTMKFKWWQKIVWRRAAKKLDVITTVSQQLANSMKSLGMGSRFDIVPNVVDTDGFNIINKSTATELFTFLHISTLVPNKNPSGIIRAFSRMKNSNCQLLIGGDGDLEPLKQTLESLPESCSKRIVLFGMKTHPEVAQLMSQSNALILFSTYENFPCVITEAWSSGTPIISTSVGGIAEFSDDSRGILLYNNSEEELTQAMELMASTPYNQKAIREYALAHFSHDAVRIKFEKLYKNLLSIK